MIIDTVRNLLDEIAVFKEVSKDLPPNYYSLISSEIQTLEKNLEQIHDNELDQSDRPKHTKTKTN